VSRHSRRHASLISIGGEAVPIYRPLPPCSGGRLSSRQLRVETVPPQRWLRRASSLATPRRRIKSRRGLGQWGDHGEVGTAGESRARSGDRPARGGGDGVWRRRWCAAAARTIALGAAAAIAEEQGGGGGCRGERHCIFPRSAFGWREGDFTI
jgi:hypothetical protein